MVTMALSTASVAPEAVVREAISSLPDPEVPVLTIADLGILREIEVDADAARVVVTITPTYSGCPAMEAIRAGIEHAAARTGYTAQVLVRLAPAWTTDWMSQEGRERLAQFGIAPPSSRAAPGSVPLSLSVRQICCPLCGSDRTEELSRFGATACKALRRCLSCREPFEEFKVL